MRARPSTTESRTPVRTRRFGSLWGTERRRDALAAATRHYRLRRAIGGPQREGAAFRDAPDAMDEVLRVAGSVENATAGLRGLARDHDRTVRERAARLLERLRSRGAQGAQPDAGATGPG